MSEFLDVVNRFNAQVGRDVPAVLDAFSDIALDEIRNGGPQSGAPGQPVSTSGSPNDGRLRDSWHKDAPSATTRVISTDVSYAPDVEDNIHGFTFHNHGPHSLKLVKAGAKNILTAAVVAVVGR